MAELKICRVCLRTAVKMYRFDQYYLKSYYEEVMATEIDYMDNLPPYFCYECAALLYKFHKFKQKCSNGQKALLEILWEQPISYEVVNKVNKRFKNLGSDLEIMAITKFVRAYAIKQEPEQVLESEEAENIEVEIKENDIAEEEEEEQKPMPDQLPFVVEEDNFDNHFSDLDETACKEEPGSPGSPDSPPLSVYAELKAEMAKNESNKKNKKVSKKEAVKKSKRNSVRSKKIEDNTTRKTREKVDNRQQKKKRSSPYKKEKIRFLDMTVWKIHNLTEEQGEAEFRKRERDPKYAKAEFHCVNCFRGFSKQYMLERHNQVRHVESIGRWQCRLCHMRFKINSNLKKHYSEHFVKYECIKCGLVCWSESHAFVHEEKHKGVKRKCQHCDREFRHLSTYYTHLRMSHRSEHLCNQCGASFVSQLGLHLHKQKCKAKRVTKEEPQEAQPAENSAVMDMETYCEKCDIRFKTKLAFEEHLQNSVLHDEGFESRRRRNEDDETDFEEGPLPFKKRHMFPRKQSAPNQDTKLPFKSHLPYRKTKPTTCYQCGKSFETQAAAMKHHKEAHPGTSFCPPNERCICEICGASLAPGSVQAHENRHYKKKLFTCNTCGRTFLTSMVLKRHMVVHTGEKPYKCTLCDKRFTQPGSMQLHYKTFHLKQPYPPRNRHKKVAEEEPSSLQNMGESSNEQDPRLQPVRFSHYLLTQQKYM